MQVAGYHQAFTHPFSIHSCFLPESSAVIKVPCHFYHSFHTCELSVYCSCFSFYITSRNSGIIIFSYPIIYHYYHSFWCSNGPNLAQECSRLISYFPYPSPWVLFLQGMQFPLRGEWHLETIVWVQVCSFDAGVTQVLFKSHASNHSMLLLHSCCAAAQTLLS